METIDLALFTQFPVGVSSEGPEGGRVLATSPSLTQHLLSLSPPGAPAVCSQSRPTASPPERICFSRASFLDNRPDGGVCDFALKKMFKSPRASSLDARYSWTVSSSSSSLISEETSQSVRPELWPLLLSPSTGH